MTIVALETLRSKKAPSVPTQIMSPGKKLVGSVPLRWTIAVEVEIHRRPAGYKERIYSQIPGSLAGELGSGAVCYLTP